MTKKTPIPALPTPTEKVIRDLIEEVRRQGEATIEGVIIHPSDLPTLGALMQNSPLPKMPSAGRPTPTTFIPPERVQTAVQAQSLTQQLEDSLWAIAEATIPATPADIAEHVPHFNGSSERIRRVFTSTVLVLCPCKTVLRFGRCKYNEGDPLNERCDEEVPVVEAGHALCVLHR
jgi:hypothetical protein